MHDSASNMNRDDHAQVPQPAVAHASAPVDKRPRRGERTSTQLVHRRPRGARRQLLNECGDSEFANAGRMARVTWCRIRAGRLIAVATLAAVVASLAGCERWSLDRQMEELCRKDGGVKVYEKVTLPASEFSNVGQPLAKYAQMAASQEDRLGPDYRYVEVEELVAGRPNADAKRGEGMLVRVRQAIFRRTDGKLLGEYVWYGRRGGDGFTFGFHPSSNSCPKPATNVANQVFVQGE